MAPLAADDTLRARWRSCLRITVSLMTIGFLVTFVIAFYARELGGLLFGWPFSFWMAAQGALVVYLALVCIYARAMRRLDARFGVAEDDGAE
jgi:putative solute:sodium symporter small subunit